MNPLQQLRDIHLPDPVSAWPPAYGWWLLAALIIGVSGGVIWYWRRRQRHYQAKREALRLLLTLEEGSKSWAGDLNAILRRVCLSYFPQEANAHIFGEAWVAYLAAKLPAKHRATFAAVMQPWQDSLYAPPASIVNFAQCLQQAQLWVRKAHYPKAVGSQQHSDNTPGGVDV